MNSYIWKLVKVSEKDTKSWPAIAIQIIVWQQLSCLGRDKTKCAAVEIERVKSLKWLAVMEYPFTELYYQQVGVLLLICQSLCHWYRDDISSFCSTQ